MSENSEKSYRAALAEALSEEMSRDDSVIMIGLDLTPQGGAFGVTLGFQENFKDQVFNAPISEEGYVGCGVGAAIEGMRPVVEIMHLDFITRAMDPIINVAAKMRFLYGEEMKAPITIRGPVAGRLSAACQHSQALYPLFMSVPGIKVVGASTPRNAKGLLKSAIRSDDPVLFVEHARLYRNREEFDEPADFTIPLGEAEIRKEGDDLTIVATLSSLGEVESASDDLKERGIDPEIIDPRTFDPLDLTTIGKSVEKTGRLLIVDETHSFGGFHDMLISGLASSESFYYLEAPIRKLGSKNTPIPFSPPLEKEFYPTRDDIISAAEELC